MSMEGMGLALALTIVTPCALLGTVISAAQGDWRTCVMHVGILAWMAFLIF